MVVQFRTRFPVADLELSALHSRAFGLDSATVRPWAERLEGHALSWVGAFDEDRLVGFVQVCWDGGEHAFLLDTAVDPGTRKQGIGTTLVRLAAGEATRAGCTWLHVDYEPHLSHFYQTACGFSPTTAGLLRLSAAGG